MRKTYKFDSEVANIVDFHYQVIKFHKNMADQAVLIMAKKAGIVNKRINYDFVKKEYYVEEDSKQAFKNKPGKDRNR